MIISRGRRFIFVHAPKTGGTSLAAALEARAMKDDILIGDTPKALRRRKRLKGLTARGRLWKHSRLSDIEGIVSPGEMHDLFVFTLVRNPWDRMVSYYHWLRAQDFDHPAVALSRAMDFHGFLNAAPTRAALRAEGYAAYIRLADGTERCDAFVRLEHLEADLAPVEAHLGFSLGPIPRLNASVRSGDHRHAYSAEDAKLVGELFADDVARFGYRF